jgi:hypothetical protein
MSLLLKMDDTTSSTKLDLLLGGESLLLLKKMRIGEWMNQCPNERTLSSLNTQLSNLLSRSALEDINII